ncbi:UNVERIFIED_CONTAM: putative carbohydrate-binding protein with starch-binding CBM53 [Acetivibrio alkalicellulosi]
MPRAKQLYADNGVEVSKSSICVGDEVTLSYSGLLAQSGAEVVYAHIGYGDEWEEKEFIPMERNKDVFEARIKVNHADNLNVAFKDNGDNWDNNSHSNYSFKISKKAAKTQKTTAETEKKATASKSSAEKTTTKKTSTTRKTATKKSDN